MTQAQLLTYALEQITRSGRADIKDIVKFIEALLKDPEAELSKIKTEMHTAFVTRQASQMAYKASLDTKVAELSTLDVAQVINHAKNPK